MNRKEQIERRQEAVRLIREEGKSVLDTSKEVGLSPTYINRLCRQEGIVTKHKVIGTSTYDIIASLLKTDLTYQVIADSFNVTRQRVGQIALELKKVGLR